MWYCWRSLCNFILASHTHTAFRIEVVKYRNQSVSIVRVRTRLGFAHYQRVCTSTLLVLHRNWLLDGEEQNRRVTVSLTFSSSWIFSLSCSLIGRCDLTLWLCCLCEYYLEQSICVSLDVHLVSTGNPTTEKMLFLRSASLCAGIVLEFRVIAQPPDEPFAFICVNTLPLRRIRSRLPCFVQCQPRFPFRV